MKLTLKFIDAINVSKYLMNVKKKLTKIFYQLFVKKRKTYRKSIH